MNLFSKLLPLLLVSQAVHAIDVSAFYVGGCERRIGVPLQVNSNSILLLTLEGEVKTVPRYEITYVANYPIDIVPFTRVSDTKSVPPIRILTRQNQELVELVTGWPVEFTDQKIAFLTIHGEGVVIDRDAIWDIQETDQTRFEFAAVNERRSVNFVHPQVFETCPSTAPKAALRAVAQQLLSEPVAIKREFDRLQKGHELVSSYQTKQKFYPYPQVYSNQTLLGLWTSVNSRYGSSGYRSNNLTPLLQSDLSYGPFSYQHRFITGSGPNLESSHEEAQTQATYQFKADYFRLGVMTDLSQILIGTNRFRWAQGDLNSRDFRLNDVARISFGVEIGSYSLIIIPVHAVNVGARANLNFDSSSVSIPRFGVAYRKAAYDLDVTLGEGSSNELSMSLLRANGRFELNSITTLVMSYIHRTAKYDDQSHGFARFRSTSDTGAATLEHVWRKRFPLGLAASVERVSIDTGLEDSATYVKAAAFFGLIF